MPGVLALTSIPWSTTLLASSDIVLDTTTAPDTPFVEVRRGGRYFVVLDTLLQNASNARKNSCVFLLAAPQDTLDFVVISAERTAYHRNVPVGLGSPRSSEVYEFAPHTRITGAVQALNGSGGLTLLAEARLSVMEVG